MKKKIVKVLGVVLSLALLSSLAMVSTPVAAQPDQNDWGEIDMPTLAPTTGVGVMAITPDGGTIFAAILNANGLGNWSVWKTSDQGVTWEPTEFTGSSNRISDIAISPNYATDGTFYIARMNGDIFRMTDEGDATPVLLKTIVDSDGNSASTVNDIDLWYDGSDIWILAGTDLDVLVLRDALFENWRDQELVAPGGTREAYEVAFAPDFNSSNLIWAVVDNGSDRYLLTSTISPGQWGMTIDDVTLRDQGGTTIRACEYVDIAFADGYTSSAPVLYVGCTDNEASGQDGNIFLVQGAVVPDTSEATPLLPVDDDIVSVEVSGNVILAGSYNSRILYISYNAGDTFTPAAKRPSGTMRFYVYMAPGAFDPDNGVAYCSSQSTSYDESAFSISFDGAQTWNQRSWIDTAHSGFNGLAFSPEGASQPALLITWGSTQDNLWRTDDITADPVVWERVLCTQVSALTYFYYPEYSMNYATDKTIMLYGYDPVGGNYEIWKSTDNAQTFSHWRTLPADIGSIWDLKVYDSATIYSACIWGNYGFYGTSLFGPATKDLAGEYGYSIAIQPGFDPDDPANSTILVGGTFWSDVTDPNYGMAAVWVSDDGGDSWGAANIVGGYGDIAYVAFDAEFTDNGLIYFATTGSEVGQAVVDGNALDDIEALTDDQDPAGTAEADMFTGIQVSSDNALYAIGGDATVATTVNVPYVTGTLDLTGDTSGAASTGANGVSIDMAVVVVTGTFVDGENVTIESAPDSILTADGYNAVSGTLYFTGDTSGAAGYIDVNFTGLTLDNATVPFQSGENVSWAEQADPNDMEIYIDTTTTYTGGDAYLFRLLLHEDENAWETAQLDGAMGLWLTEGSNYLWTLAPPSSGVMAPAIWALEDTLSGPVTGVTVSGIGETKATVSWSAMTGADEYEYRWDSSAGSTDKTTAKLSGLDDNTDYDVKVRVAIGEPWHSRWSTEVSFTTIEAIAMPENQVPVNGMQSAPILPSFVWKAVPNAVSYEFQLSTNPAYTQANGFGSPIVDEVIMAPTTAYTCATELAYDTDHYWIVRAVSATGTKSDWCFSNFHTMLEPIEPVPPVTIPPQPTPTIILPTPTVTVNIPPQPTPTITVPPAQVTVIPPDITVIIPEAPPVTVTQVEPNIVMPKEVTPVYIWIIVAIGAVLVIAVIVLIIRTRRVV